MTIRPRRSALYMPAANARAIDKARGLPADAVILDLEDSVAPDGKAAARWRWWTRSGPAASAARGGRARQRPRHALGCRRPHRPGRGDARRGAGAQGFHVRSRRPIGLRRLAMGTTGAPGLGHDRDLPCDLRASRGRRLAGSGVASAVRMGTNDLAKEIRCLLIPDPRRRWPPWCEADGRPLYGLDILDGVFNDLADAEGFAPSAEGATSASTARASSTRARSSPPTRLLAGRRGDHSGRAMVAAFACRRTPTRAW